MQPPARKGAHHINLSTSPMQPSVSVPPPEPISLWGPCREDPAGPLPAACAPPRRTRHPELLRAGPTGRWRARRTPGQRHHQLSLT
eukprot:1557723-Pyramimonas_sp.AAC.1